MKRIVLVSACVAALSVACASPSNSPERVMPADLAPEVDGAKNDALSNWFTDVLGSIGYESITTGTTDGFVGYTFEASAGDIAGFDIVSTDWTLTYLYGPRKANGRFGKPVVKATTDFIDWGHDAGAITYEVPKDGEYMLVVGPIFYGAVTYEVGLGCGGGPCAEPAACGAPEAFVDVSLDDLLNDPKAWIGQAVAVTAPVDAGPMYCTKMACSQDNPCCNTCGAGMQFIGKGGNGVASEVDLEGLSCGGNECTAMDECSYPIGDTVTVWGVVAENYGHLSIAVEGSCAGEQDTSTLGQSCGSWAGTTCDEGQFCDYQPGATCGWADAPGTCAEIPTACIEIYQPVCGCDGQTYPNSCYAAAAATGVLHEGACECTGTTPAPEGTDVTGIWTATGEWQIDYTFSKDGTVTKTDYVSPCPEGVVCFWSGIVTNTGTWQSVGSGLELSWETNDTTGGVVLYNSLKVRTTCDGGTELHDGQLEFVPAK